MMPLDAHLDQPRHVGALVDGPGDDLEPERAGFRQRFRGDIAVVGRPDRAAGRGHQPRRRAAEIVDVEARRPWRGARLAALERVAAAAVDASGRRGRSPARCGAWPRACASRRIARSRARPGSASRTAFAKAAAKVSGSGVSAPEAGVNLVSILKRTWSAFAWRTRSNTSASGRDADAVHPALLGEGRRVGACPA